LKTNELKTNFQNSGIVGCGGAGFPTYAKLDERAEVIILNCAECEPLLKSHQQLLSQNAFQIANTFHKIAETIGAQKAIIGIKKTYKSTILAVNECLTQIPQLSLGLLDEIYPAGDEAVLIYELTGIVIPPGSLPIESGIIVFNVETIYNAYRYLESGTPVTDKWVTVAGEVETPLTINVPIGTSAADAVMLAGGSKIKDPVYYFGGPMMGTIASAITPITKTTNAILILPEDHLLVRRKRRKASVDLKRAAACCCQCEMCTELCPRHLLGHPVSPHLFMRAAVHPDNANSEKMLNTLFCSSCGLCENFACMQGLSPRSLMADYKTRLREQGIKAPNDVLPAPLNSERKYKRVPQKRLLARLDLMKYQSDAPMSERAITINKVKLLLNQHIGNPSIPNVELSEKVTKGQLIAKPSQGLSVALHASITGTISAITENYIEVINEQSNRHD